MTSKATDATRQANAEFAAHLPLHDRQDFADAEQGFIARSIERQITTPDGRVVWDLDAYSFLDADVPDTANPSLWRQSQLLIKDGLFEVAPGIYQLRGFDLSVMSVVETDTGVIVIDPLISCETAAAAFALYTAHRGERPIQAVIYTHSHVDHFGGVKGLISQAEVDAGHVQVIAPEGFMEHAIVENVFAGTAMSRRAGYMYGAAVAKGPDGQIGAGLGQTTSTGEVTLITPTVDITHTGQELNVDGVAIVFQVTPGTEAPAEMNFFFPHAKALCAAENASHTMHNILTIRGAVVRDAHAWAHYLTETIDIFGDDLEVVFASHHWPTWGQQRAVEYLALQRDMYLYLHDQTLRMINQGYVGAEIAEMIQMPPALTQAWHTHGYYGTVSHNVKAIYQRYLGWYEGNPARLWPHPPEASARRYVDAMGGAGQAVMIAQHAFDEGDYRWAAQVLDHVLFAEPSNAAALALQADTFEQLAFIVEAGTWRSAYLAGATELRVGNFGTPAASASPDILGALTVSQVFDSLAIRVDGPKAWDEHLVFTWHFTDEGTTYLMELRNGVLVHRISPTGDRSGTMLTLSRTALIGLVTGQVDPASALQDGTISVDGDPRDLGRLLAVLVPGDPDFAIVTP